MSTRLTATLSCLGALAVAACSDSSQPSRAAAERGVPVIVETLRFEPARTRAEAVGTSRAILSAELYPATSGEVAGVNFEPGQFVPVLSVDRP